MAMRPRMKTLHLLRHAKSSWADPGADDHARPLNKRGRRAADLMAEHVAALPEPPELILASDAARTRETLQSIAAALARPARVLIERELYLAPCERLLARLGRVEEEVASVLLIAHNPGLHELALRLAATQPHAAQRFGKFPTAALASFAVSGPWRELQAGGARLRDYVTPGDLSPSDGDDD
jgi:phosphohistidine phosphatase